MKKIKNLIFYIAFIGGFSLLMYLVFEKGKLLETDSVKTFTSATAYTSWEQFVHSLKQNFTHPLIILLMQIIIILIATKVFGFICKKIGQPTVVGEIAAGIFLGPSFIGTWFPGFSNFIFPHNSLGNLQFLSQIGLILFMFVIGMELDLKILKKKASDAVVISHASIVVPFALGVSLAYLIYNQLAPPNINFISFSLFLGIAMSITAFPVLARIVQEKGLSKTKLGTIAITCAAADDLTAWCLLAAVIAIVKAGSFVSAIFTIFSVLVYLIIMWKIVRPFLKKTGDIYSNKEGLSKPIVSIFFSILLISAFATEFLGIHVLFGAFVAGVMMPDNVRFRNIFIEKVEDVAIVILLPLFFALSGLRTQIGLLNDPYLWEVCGAIIAVAIAGKFLASALAARYVGQGWRDSLIIGALMNTRGLMELIVVNIGYDMGVLKPEVFAMLVIMALVTTFMTGPALYIIKKWMPEKRGPIVENSALHSLKYNILISFGSPQGGKNLVKLAYALVSKMGANATVTALHLSPSSDVHQYNVDEYEKESFEPIKEEAGKLSLPLVTLFKPAMDIDKEIIHTANAGMFDLLLVGIGRSVFEGTLFGKVLGFTTKFISPERLYDTLRGKEKLFENHHFDERTQHFIKSVKTPLGVLIVNDNFEAANIFMPVLSVSDSFLLGFAQKLIHNHESRIAIFDSAGIIMQNPEFKENIRSVEQIAPNYITLFSDSKPGIDFLNKQDMMLISLESWRKAVEAQSPWLLHASSILILKP